MISQWLGYNSATDKTNLAPNVFVQGSENVYKKLSGTIAVRPGQKRRGSANTTLSPVFSEFVWNTSWGATYPLWVTNSTLQVEYNDTWYTLLSGLTTTRYVFDKWWDNTQKKDNLLFVKGDSQLQRWSGGITTITSFSNASGVISSIDSVPTSGGAGYSVGDILIISGGTATATVLTVTGGNAGSIIGIQLGAPGTGYHVGDVLTLPTGSSGTVTVTAVDTGGFGEITAFTLTTAGTGYSSGNYYTPTGGFGAGSTFLVTSVGGQAVATVSLTTTDAGYTTGTGKATTGGKGTGATLDITAVVQGYIASASPFQQSGFDASGNITIEGISYTYIQIVDKKLIGISPDPSVITGTPVGFQDITDYNGVPASNFNADFLKVINNQVYIGSYTSRLCYISQNIDFTNYVVPNPRVAGSPELLTLDAAGKGIGVRQGKAHVGFGTGGWAVVSFNDITVGTTLTQQTVVDIKPVSHLTGPYAHEFIDTVGDTLVYLSQDQQVRTFTDAVSNLFTSAYPSISQEIATELSAEDFTNGALKCIGEFTYLTAPNAGKVYLYQVRQTLNSKDQVISERLWHSPFIWNLTRVDEIGGIVYGFSNANPQVYQLWDTGQWHDDSPSDEPLPYSSVLALSYRSGRRQGLQSFDKNFTEGYITDGTPLNLLINYNYKGATNSVGAVINSVALPGFKFSPAFASLGDNSLGDEPLGNGGITDPADDLSSLSKFKVINSLPLINCFEYQTVFYSDIPDAQWEILATGTNAVIESDEQANFIINKQRNR